MGEVAPAEVVASLGAKALETRRNVVRMIFAAGRGYPGGSLSVADLVTALVLRELRLDPARPDWPERDRLVLSKGHAAPALYAALALRGFLPLEELATYGQTGSRLPGSPDRERLRGVEATTGGLGQGVGMAVGMALDARLAGRPSRVYAIVGDGECQVGATWEALLAAGHFRLENFVVIVDRNGYEMEGTTESILGVEPIADKLRAFRFHTLEIDGHDFRQILEAFATARSVTQGPTAIVARTVSGKGVSFMENAQAWHGRPPSRAEAERALAELGVPAAEAGL
jgi:transketolase